MSAPKVDRPSCFTLIVLLHRVAISVLGLHGAVGYIGVFIKSKKPPHHSSIGCCPLICCC